MKHKVFMVLILSFILISISSTFAAEGPGLYYDFYYEWDESWSYVPISWEGTMCSLEYSNNALKMDMTGGDPSFALEIREPIDLAEYPFIKIKVKNESAVTELFELYIARDGENLAEGNNFKYNIGKEHTEFKEYVIDATKVKGASWWTGEITLLRFDGLNNPASEGGDVLYVEHIAFFKTQEDAEAWTPDRSQTPPPTPSPTPEPTPTPVPTDSPEPTEKPKTGNSSSKGISTPVIVVSGIIVVAAVVVAVLLIVKRRKA